MEEMARLAVKLKSQHAEHKEKGEMHEFGDSMEDVINRLCDLAIKFGSEGVKQDVAA
jgi:hypothetical protein